jgi:hypothetical protein
MGELTRFDNVRIYMNYMDIDRHKEPHFHIELTDGMEASISIATGKILAGKIDKRTNKIISAWILIHKEELWDRWNKAVSGKNFEKISPKIYL